MKKVWIVAVALLLMTGCTADAPEAGLPQVEDVQAAPLNEETEASDQSEDELLEMVREYRAVPILDSLSDEEVLAAAHEACAQLESGTRLIEVDVIEQADPAKEAVLLTKTAHELLCPDAPMDMNIMPEADQ